MPDPKTGSDEFLKIAVIVKEANQTDPYISISVTTPVSGIIQDQIERYKLPGVLEDYALVFQKSGKIKEYKIVNEKNKHEMHGQIVELVESPAKSTKKILQQINDVTIDSKDLENALEELKDMSTDPTFAEEFISQNGLQFLMLGVSKQFRINEQGLVLHSIQSLLEHATSGLDSDEDGDAANFNIEPDESFIKHLADLTCKESKEPTLSLAIRCALSILSIFVREDKSRDMIEQNVAFSNLIALLGHNDVSIQLASLGLINNLLESVSQERKHDMVRSLHDRTARNMIIDHLLTKDKGGNIMSHYLYLLQYHMLSVLQIRLNSPIQPLDGGQLDKIKDLRIIAFDTGSQPIKNNAKYAQDHTKLGFRNTIDPSLDFAVTPPGILALDCMHYFAKQHQEKYMKVVLENSCRNDNHECPFAESSCELVKLLADILGVGKLPIPNHTRYHEMFFKVECPFEEFFSHSIVILNKTWRDMRATKLDFTKVLDVVREQLEASLMPEGRNVKIKTFDQFKSGVKSYSEISKKWHTDANSREAWIKSKPVTELKQHLQGEIGELIRQQRTNFMVEGTRFNRIKKTGEQKGQYKYVKLHNNHKTIYVGDWNNEKSAPNLEDLEPKLYVADVVDIKTGSDCEFTKEFKTKDKDQYARLAFSLVGENVSLLDLVAPDVQTHNYWVDGMNTLLGRDMSSSDYNKEKNILTNMEIKLRLLDLEGVDLPEDAPPIPPPPSDFNFAS